MKAGVDKWTAANPAPAATIADVADHVDHIRKIAGIDHIGIGGDFDGITQTVKDLDNVSTYPRLTAELLKRGYSDADVKKILGQNILRVDARGREGLEAAPVGARPSVRVVDRRCASPRGLLSDGARAPARTARRADRNHARSARICFGTCPEYTVTMRGDGTVTYSGRQLRARRAAIAHVEDRSRRGAGAREGDGGGRLLRAAGRVQRLA